MHYGKSNAWVLQCRTAIRALAEMRDTMGARDQVSLLTVGSSMHWA